MRVLVCVVAFIVLLLVGFLATPGVFKTVNPDYWLALREYADPLAKAAKDLSDIDSKLVDYQSRIWNLEKSLADTATQAAAKAASLQTANAPPKEIADAGIYYGSQANRIGNELNQLKAERDDLVGKRAGIETNRAELRKKIDSSASESVNIHLVTRALALGAVGALMSIFAKFLFAQPRVNAPFETSMGRIWASMAMGGVVAVVVIGLFLTGFISIFSNSAQNAGPTDFWKVTILCLFAGAFSDRLFQAASGRMDGYLKTATGGRESDSQSHTAASRTPKKRPSRSPNTEQV